MCGIIGILSNDGDVGKDVLHALSILEYRGYDSAGMVLSEFTKDGKFQAIHTVGPIYELQKVYDKSNICGNIGIGHTRWATHGVPAIRNTHPIICDDIAVVHNGIIDNYLELKKFLIDHGFVFKSETDTEVIVNLIKYYKDLTSDFKTAVYEVCRKLKGMFAFVVISESDPGVMIGVRNGSALVVGVNENKDGNNIKYFVSDSNAISHNVSEIIHMEDREVCILTNDAILITDFDKKSIYREKQTISEYTKVTKGDFEYFMLKEIYEQPMLMQDLVSRFQDTNSELSHALNKISELHFQNIYLIACGTSFYAAYIAKYWIEELTDKSVQVEIASEFRSRKVNFDKNSLYILISQSGETADTLASLQKCKISGVKTLGITNVASSQLASKVDYLLATNIGAEIAVAATKTFTAQLMMLLFLICSITDKNNGYKLTELLQNDIELIKSNVRNLDEQTKTIVNKIIVDAKNLIYIGRGPLYPLVMEGALKMKELAYIPSEGLAAGELKHGSIALIERGVPVIVLAGENDELFYKLASNIEEIKARNGTIIFVGNSENYTKIMDSNTLGVTIPKLSQFGTIFGNAIVLQLLAYNTAFSKGLNVDKPRNLAKSVTVE